MERELVRSENKYSIKPINSKGEPHGLWILRNYKQDIIYQGEFINGKKHGEHISSLSRTKTVKKTYSHGIKNGRVESSSYRILIQGHYINGRRHGEWVKLHKEQNIREFENWGEKGPKPYAYIVDSNWNTVSKQFRTRKATVFTYDSENTFRKVKYAESKTRIFFCI